MEIFFIIGNGVKSAFHSIIFLGIYLRPSGFQKKFSAENLLRPKANAPQGFYSILGVCINIVPSCPMTFLIIHGQKIFEGGHIDLKGQDGPKAILRDQGMGSQNRGKNRLGF